MRIGVCARRHLAVQEEPRRVQVGLEGEAEALPVLLRELTEAQRVVGGTNGLDERVGRLHFGVGVGRNEARQDVEAHVGVVRR